MRASMRSRGGTSRRWQRIALLAWLPLNALGCNALNLAFVPTDLAARVFHGHLRVSRLAAAGPIEKRLLEAAEREGRLELVGDTRDPAHDAKLHARACDAGEARACTDVGALFFYFLREPELGVELLERACNAGDTAACLRASEALALNRPQRDWDRHLSFAHQACVGRPPFGRACYDEARPPGRFLPKDAEAENETSLKTIQAGRFKFVLVVENSKTTEKKKGERTFTLFAARRYHHACELGDEMACDELTWAFHSGSRGLPKDPETAGYLSLLELIAGYAPGLIDGDRFALERQQQSEDWPHGRERSAVGAEHVDRRIFEALGPAFFRERVESIYRGRPWVKRMYEREHPPDLASEAKKAAADPEAVAIACFGSPSLVWETFSRIPRPEGFTSRWCASPSVPPRGWTPFETEEPTSARCASCLLECDALEPDPSPEEDGCLCACALDRGGCGIRHYALEGCLEALSPDGTP